MIKSLTVSEKLRDALYYNYEKYRNACFLSLLFYRGYTIYYVLLQSDWQ